MTFLLIWKSTNPYVTAWGSASHLSDGKGSNPLKRLKTTGL